MLLDFLGSLNVLGTILLCFYKLLLALSGHVGREGCAQVRKDTSRPAVLHVATIDNAIGLELAQKVALPTDFTDFNMSFCVVSEEQILVLCVRFDPASKV